MYRPYTSNCFFEKVEESNFLFPFMLYMINNNVKIGKKSVTSLIIRSSNRQITDHEAIVSKLI